MRWNLRRRSTAETIGIGAVAVALIAAPIAGFAIESASASPAPPLVSVNFDDKSTGALIQDGSPTSLTYEHVDGPATDFSLRVDGRAQDFDGVQTAGLSSLQAGDVVGVCAQVRTATTGVSGTAKIVADDGHYTTVGASGAFSNGGWTAIGGTYTVPAGLDTSTLKFYVGTSAPDAPATGAYDYYVDDFTVTLPGATCPTRSAAPSDGCTYPTTDQVVASDFEDGATDGWTPRDDGNGVATVAVTTADSHAGTHALAVTNRAGQGQGIKVSAQCVLQPGATYEFSGWARFAAGQPTDDIWLSADTSNYPTLGQFTGMSNSGWVHLDQKFTMPTGTGASLYLQTRWISSTDPGNKSDLLFDDLTITKVTATVQDITPIKDTLPFPVGAAVSDAQLVGAPGQLLDKHFDQVTAENAMKVESWYNADHTFKTTNTSADNLMQYAKDNGLRVYGHNLVWYQQTPDWFFQDANGNFLTSSPADQQVMRDRLKTHIDNVASYLVTKFGQFGSAGNPLVSFDVVNEVVSDNAGDPEGLRQSHWYQILGDEYIKDAFDDANAAFNESATNTKSGVNHPIALFINDYNTEQPGKRQRLQTLVGSLIAAGTPIDGVGHQFHVTMATPVSTLKDAIDAFNGVTTSNKNGLTAHPLYQAVTELDVPTGTPVTQANLIDQGYYYRDVFDMLRAEYTAHGNIFSATVWGLTDGQSWRASSGAPLVFDDNLQAKPAYYGITDQQLPDRIRTALVFQQSASDVDASSSNPTADVEWSKLPLTSIDPSAAFQLRWSADHLTAFVSVTDSTSNATDAVTFRYGSGQTATVKRSGTVTGTGVTAKVASTSTGWKVVANLPESTALAYAGSTQFDVAVTDGATTTGWNSGTALGTLQLIEPLSYTEIPEATTAPTIDGTKDAVWDSSSAVVTSKKLSGADDGAKATVHQLWKDNYLYVLAEVTDPTIDSSSPNAYEQDSVEIFTDPGNAKNGSYRPDDAQMRIGANGAVSFGGGDTEAAQQARLQSAAAIVPGGYVVEARIDLKDGNTGVGKFEGVDYEVNDGTAGKRTANFGWAEQTGTAYQTTARWGVAQLVAASTNPGGNDNGSGTGNGNGNGNGGSNGNGNGNSGQGNGPQLKLSASTVQAGGFVVVTASGATPGATAQVILHSAPVVLATGKVAADGTYSGSVKIPAKTPAGLHHVELAVNGASTTVPLTVTAADPSSLASTGSDARAIALVALLALLLGGLALGGARVAKRRH